MRIVHPAGSRWRLPVLVAAMSAAVIGGSAYAATSSTVSASATDTVVTLASANRSLSVTGGEMTPVLMLRLPDTHKASHYVLAAQGDLVNFGPSDYTRCNIVVNDHQVAAVSTIVGDPSAPGTEGPAAFVSPFALTGGVTVPKTGATAVLQCWHDNTFGATPYVDTNASLWAHRTASLHLGTE